MYRAGAAVVSAITSVDNVASRAGAFRGTTSVWEASHNAFALCEGNNRIQGH